MHPLTTLHRAKIEDWSAAYSGPRFHAVLSDPPYGLEFMGKEWDAPHKATSFPKQGTLGGFADGNKPSFARQGSKLRALVDVYATWGEALLPLLYPGAIVLMFGGTRTWHHLASGMELAGFEMWDTLMWIHGQGFPKAQDISKLIDKQNGDERGEVMGATSGPNGSRYDGERYSETRQTAFGPVQDQPARTAAGSEQSAPWSGHKTCALKPAWEPVLCFKAPNLGKSYAQLATEYGSGCLNVDGGRISVADDDYARNCSGDRGHADNRVRDLDFAMGCGRASDIGRYPANVILDELSAELLDEQTGELTSGANPVQRHSDKTRGVYGEFQGHDCFPARGADSGGASRFFYCAKASTSERNAGCDELPETAFGMSNQAKAEVKRGTEDFKNAGLGVNTVKMRRNTHPTIKPIDLARYLATLLLPPDSVKPRRLLVPFAGSGSEMIGAMLAGWDEIVGVEQDLEGKYIPIAEARIAHWRQKMESEPKQETLFSK